MAVEQFTYTGSPWGYSAPGWTVFQRSPGIAPKRAESLLAYFRYSGGPDDPVQFLHFCAGGAEIVAQSRDSGLRWYDENRGHDYFAHVLLDETPRGFRALPFPDYSPFCLYLSPDLQTEFPGRLRSTAQRVFDGKLPNDEPPHLAPLDSFSDVAANPGFRREATARRLPAGALRKIPAIARAMEKRIEARRKNSPLVFSAENGYSLDTMALALSLVKPSLRCKANFATWMKQSSIDSLPEKDGLDFYRTGAPAGRAVDPDTGFAGEVSSAGLAEPSSVAELLEIGARIDRGEDALAKKATRPVDAGALQRELARERERKSGGSIVSDILICAAGISLGFIASFAAYVFFLSGPDEKILDELKKAKTAENELLVENGRLNNELKRWKNNSAAQTDDAPGENYFNCAEGATPPREVVTNTVVVTQTVESADVAAQYAGLKNIAEANEKERKWIDGERRKIEEYNKGLDKKKKGLDEREKKLDEREKALGVREDALQRREVAAADAAEGDGTDRAKEAKDGKAKSREAELEKREKAVKKREDDAKANEKALSKREDDIRENEIDLKSKSRKLKDDREKFDKAVSEKNEELNAREKEVERKESDADAIMRRANEKEANIDKLIREGVETKYKELEAQRGRR